MSDLALHGTFCWFELATTDSVAARPFYAALLGWGYREVPMPGGASSPYVLAVDGEARIAGMHTLSEGERAAGIAPHWSSYLAVQQADESAARVEQLGGSIIEGPMDIPQLGRMAVCRDPAGAVFQLWQSKGPRRGVTHGDGRVGSRCWSELISDDVGASAEFFSAFCGWSATEQHLAGGPPYTVFRRGEAQVAGLTAKQPHHGPMPSAWIVYWHVADIHAAVRTVESAGGRVLFATRHAPGAGPSTWIADPQGAVSAIVTLTR